MLQIDARVSIPDDEIEFQAIRAGGPGGQNVNKVATAVHLRFDIRSSSLPATTKERLLALSDHRISREGVINIKAQQARSQERNRQIALDRLAELIRRARVTRKKRIPSKPGPAAKARRLDAKTRRSRLKTQRARVRDHD